MIPSSLYRFILFFVVAVGLFLLGLYIGRAGQPEVVESVRIDTVFYEKPKPTSVEARPVTVRAPRLIFAERVVEVGVEPAIATVATFESDSVDVEISIETLQYEDSTYRAQVSGPRIGQYGPQLDWIEQYNRTVTQSVARRSRFAITVGAGVGLTPKGFQPIIAITGGFILFQEQEKHYKNGASYAPAHNK